MVYIVARLDVVVVDEFDVVVVSRLEEWSSMVLKDVRATIKNQIFLMRLWVIMSFSP